MGILGALFAHFFDSVLDIDIIFSQFWRGLGMISASQILSNFLKMFFGGMPFKTSIWAQFCSIFDKIDGKKRAEFGSKFYMSFH